eukprot:Gb_37639 [translate_table: standard]
MVVRKSKELKSKLYKCPSKCSEPFGRASKDPHPLFFTLPLLNLVLWAFAHDPTRMLGPAANACVIGTSENDSRWCTKGNFDVQFSKGEGVGQSPPLTWPRGPLSSGPTHPNQKYDGIYEKQHLTMLVTGQILTNQCVPEEIAMIATVSLLERCDNFQITMQLLVVLSSPKAVLPLLRGLPDWPGIESAANNNILIKCLEARLKRMIVNYVPHQNVK